MEVALERTGLMAESPTGRLFRLSKWETRMRTKTHMVQEWREGEKGREWEVWRSPQGEGWIWAGVSTVEPEVAGGWPECSSSYPRGRPSRFTSASMAMLLRCIFLWPSWWQSQVLPEPAELQTWGWLIRCKENFSKPVLLMENMCWVHTCGSVYVPCYTFDFSYFTSPRCLLLCAVGGRMRWAPYLSVFHYLYVDIVLASVYLDSSKQNT